MIKTKARKRYSLAELLKGLTPKLIKSLKDKTKWFRKEKPMGREIL